ncbi:hypothetical protein LEP1GSC060_0315 [Leptospira weilii serovar Ranarum str. ICFT]|uniref:Uncharacterized protein n=1 Tax=Leptospira weilii serovar Ranarum str. ICFT TaxID=1218598 RepID=N1WH34_9LEPT|nr:hypothetical protein LEP1GSC060_0315 [Leptospira weilii serovar Ranarum str. ICFT]
MKIHRKNLFVQFVLYRILRLQTYNRSWLRGLSGSLFCYYSVSGCDAPSFDVDKIVLYTIQKKDKT